MDIPKLKRESRSREYESYTDAQRAEVVRTYLFEGISHRQIDRDVLELDMDYSKGWQSMGILHYLGLNKPFKGLFSGMSVELAIEEMRLSTNDDYSAIISVLQGFVTDEDVFQHDIEVETSENYEVQRDGRRTQYYTTRYERNPKNRRQAIKIHGTKCMACGFDFEAFYGVRGRDYIEVHHIVPLASLLDEVTVNPETDLIVVCSNCHRMIHRRQNEILSLDELRKLIFENHNGG